MVVALPAFASCHSPDGTSGGGGDTGGSAGMATGASAGTSSGGAAGSVTGGTSPSAGVSGTGTGGSSPAGASSGGAAGAGSAGTSAGGMAGASTGGGGTGGTAGANVGGAGGTAGGNVAGTGGASSGGKGGSGAGGMVSVFPPGVTRPKIMIVGDSISAGPGCYKKYLVQNLTSHQLTNYDFVGQYTDSCGGGVRHSAVSCTTTTNYTQAMFSVPNCTGTTMYPGMSTLVATHNPDLILLELGVNDVWGGGAPIQPILNNYTTLVTQARAHNPRIAVMVAQIHKIITDSCTNMASTTNAEQLVMAVPGWAAGITTANSPVLVADLWTNSDPHQSADCVHPDDAGAQRMGLNWYNALAPILR